MPIDITRREFLKFSGFFFGNALLRKFNPSVNLSNQDRREEQRGLEGEENKLFTEYFEYSAPLIISCTYKELISASSEAIVERQIKNELRRLSGNKHSSGYSQIANVLRLIGDSIRGKYPSGENFCFIFTTNLNKPQYCRVGNIGSVWQVDSAGFEGVSAHEMFIQELSPERSVIYSRNGVIVSPNSQDQRNWTFYSTFSTNSTQKFSVNGYVYPVSLFDELRIKRTVVGTTFGDMNGMNHVWEGLVDGIDTELTVVTENRDEETGIVETMRSPVYLGEKIFIFASIGGGTFLRIQKPQNFSKDGYYADLYSSDTNSFSPLKEDAYTIRMRQMLKQLNKIPQEDIVFSRRKDKNTEYDLFVIYKNSSNTISLSWIEGGTSGPICSNYSFSGSFDFTLFKNSFVFSKGSGDFFLIGKNEQDGKYYQLIQFDKQHAQLIQKKEYILPTPTQFLSNVSG